MTFLGKIIFKPMFVYFKQLKISFVSEKWLRFKWSRSRVAPEFLSLREPGSGCSKVVEHMPLEQKLVGSNPAGCLAFFFFFLSFPFSPHAKSVEFPIPGPSRRCISTNDEMNPKNCISSAAWGKAS